MTKTDPTFKALLDDRAKANERIEQLEQLCRDLWEELEVHGYKAQTVLKARYQKRMDALGLLEGESE